MERGPSESISCIRCMRRERERAAQCQNIACNVREGHSRRAPATLRCCMQVEGSGRKTSSAALGSSFKLRGRRRSKRRKVAY
eukprot:364594-Chlamydomonas_euryale.AAC.6